MAKNRQCAYCGIEAALTREHVFPGFIIAKERERDASPLTSNVLNDGTERTVAGDITIGDVCEACNNGFLSDLDSYGAQLYGQYFIEIPRGGTRIDFQYRFDLLARWLLKLTYNAGRMRKWPAHFIDFLKGSLGYICGESARLQDLDLYLQLIRSERLSDTQQQKLLEQHDLRAEEVEPRIRRFVVMEIPGRAIIFLVGMNAYHFHLVFWDGALSSAERKAAERKLLKQLPGARPLQPSMSKVVLYSSSVSLVDIAKENSLLRNNMRRAAEWMKARSRSKTGRL
jgi:hypothetical protein